MTDIDYRVYGFVNGEPVYSRDEFIYKKRGFGAIEDDEALIEFARKRTSDWHSAGWSRTFITYYLSDYALSEPYASLTKTEFVRLKELQAEAEAEYKAAEEAREWRLVDRIAWADNSIEEYYEDKDGNKKSVMVVAPHGDIC